MRILITGFVIFVIWCFISAWLYNDKILPVLKTPGMVNAIPDSPTKDADSILKVKASMPADLLIYFEFNDTKFKTDTQSDNRIAEFKRWLDRFTGSMISVTGNTDLVGTADFNDALGHKRAFAVGKYLQDKGINADRIITKSQGKNKPVADYLTEEGRAKNRRTEVSIKMK